MHPSTGVRGHRPPAMPESAACSWYQLRAEYFGSPALSLRALAAARGVSYDALKRRARREGWAAARAADVSMSRRRRDLEELATARAAACTAARRLLAMPADADLEALSRASRAVCDASGKLAGFAMHAARLGHPSP